MMDFTLGAIDQSLIDAANMTERVGGNYVKEPGAYVGIIENAILKYFGKDRTGAAGLEITMKTEEGLLCKVFMLTMKKDGSSTCKPNAKGEVLPLPGINQIRASLMPVLRMRELKAVDNGDEIIYPALVGKKLGMMVDIRKTLGETGGKPDPKKVYENAALKTFFCPATKLCGSEILEKKTTPERFDKIVASLRVIDETAIVAAGGGVNPADPFSDAGTGADMPDPFASTPVTTPAVQESKPAPVQAPVETAPVQESKPAPVESKPAPVETPVSVSAAGGEADDFWK